MTIVTSAEESAEKFKIAVYGSLRKGLGNHRVIEGADFLGDFETQPEYTMYSIGGAYPGLLKDGNTSIQMEVYEVDEETFDDVNNLEGYVSKDYEYNMYDRQEIKTPYGMAYVYLYNGDTKQLFDVESGDWTKYKKTANLVNEARC